MEVVGDDVGVKTWLSSMPQVCVVFEAPVEFDVFCPAGKMVDCGVVVSLAKGKIPTTFCPIKTMAAT